MSLTLIQADIEHGVLEIEDESVDLAFLSPPYKERDGFSMSMMRALGRLLARVLVPGGRAWMDFGPVKEGIDRPYVARDVLVRAGLTPWQTVAWVKSIAINGVTTGHYQPINSDSLMNYCWEPVFQFVKGSVESAAKLDRLGIGVPFADKSNLERGERGKNGDLHCGGDVWYVPYETTGRTKKKDHEHEFPAELVRRAVVVSNLKPGSVVFDPFMGGGTTALVSGRLGHDVIGVDRNPDRIAKAQARWRDEFKTEPRVLCGRMGAPPGPALEVRAVRPGVFVIDAS